MTTNQQLALLFIATGVMDFVLGFYLGSKMSPTGRRMLLFFGSVFLVLGAAMLLGRLHLV